MARNLDMSQNNFMSLKDRHEWIKKANDLETLESKMKKTIEHQIGPKYLERLKTIDKEYATKIAPLYDNALYQEMLGHGQTSKNIMKFLHGNTPGNETLNSIVNKNPELQRLIVGQRYAAKPSKLSQPSEALKRYATLNPVISKLIHEQN